MTYFKLVPARLISTQKSFESQIIRISDKTFVYLFEIGFLFNVFRLQKHHSITVNL